MSEPLPPVPSVIKTVIGGATSFLKDWLTVFHFLYAGASPTTAVLAYLAQSALNTFQTEFLPITPPSTTISNSEVTDLSSSMMPTAIFFNSVPGTSTADKLPANCSLLYNWKVGMRYRGGHPRNYIYAGTDENLANESQWNSAFITTAGTAMTNFIATMTGLSDGGTTITGPVMVSYFGGAPTVDGVSQRRVTPLVLPISFPVLNPFVGSQRRRIGRSS